MPHGEQNRIGETSFQIIPVVQTRYEGGLDTTSDNRDGEKLIDLRSVLAVEPTGPTEEGGWEEQKKTQISSERHGLYWEPVWVW